MALTNWDLFLVTLVPALFVDDLGKVFGLTGGSLGGATMSHLGPGLLCISFYGSVF